MNIFPLCVYSYIAIEIYIYICKIWLVLSGSTSLYPGLILFPVKNPQISQAALEIHIEINENPLKIKNYNLKKKKTTTINTVTPQTSIKNKKLPKSSKINQKKHKYQQNLETKQKKTYQNPPKHQKKH